MPNMCGIVGLYVKNDKLGDQLGALFEPMLIEMTNRGPDSAGVAIYHNPARDGVTKITAFHPDPGLHWGALTDMLRDEFDGSFEYEVIESHCVISTSADAEAVLKQLRPAIHSSR